MDNDLNVTIARAKALETLCFDFWIHVQRLQARLTADPENVEPTELW